MTAAQRSGGAVASEAEVDAVAMLLALDAYERGLREMGCAPKLGLDAVWRWLFDEDRARHRDFARRILDAAAAARPAPAGEAVEVERLRAERDEAFRRHAITEREACDAATRIGDMVREVERSQLQLVTTRTQRDTAQLRAARACDRATAAEAALAEARECLFRLKTECEIEGMDKRPGFDAWVAWANQLLAGLDAPVSRPGRLASEDARAEATRLPEQPSQGFARQSRGQDAPIALASQSKTDAAARVQIRNPINGDHHVLDTDTGRTVETRRDGPAPGVPVVEPKGRGGGDGT